MSERQQFTPEEEAEVEGLVAGILPSQYSHPRVINRGSQRAVLDIEMAPRGIRRVVKVDYGQPGNERAAIRAQHGHGTFSEIDLLQLVPDPEKHGIDAPIEFIDRRNDKGIVLAIHNPLNGESLEERVARKPLTYKEAVSVFTQLFRTTQHYRKYGVLHRDANPDNIFIENNGGVKLTDFANGCEDSSCDDRVVLSVGGRATDPVLVEGRRYGEDSEMHGQCTALAYGIIGKYFTKADTLRKRLVAVDTDESLLGADGRIDHAKYSAALDRYLTTVPKNAKRLVPFLRRGLSLENRFQSVSEAVEFFKRQTKKTLVEKATERWKPLAAIAASGIILSGGLGFGAYKQRQAQEAKQVQAVEDASRYPVMQKVNGNGLEIDNNIIELKEPRVVVMGQYTNSYPSNTDLLNVKPGDKLDIDIIAKEKPWENKHGCAQINYSGRVYFEGTAGTNFSIYPESFNEAYTRDMGTSGWKNIWNFPVPEGLRGGVRNLIVEIYAPSEGEPSCSHYKDAGEHVRFSNPGKALCRKVIPMVVGNPKTEIHLSELLLEGYTEHANFRHPSGKGMYNFRFPSGMKYKLSIPENGYESVFDSDVGNSSSDFVGLRLPSPTNSCDHTLIISALEGGTNEVYTTAIPVSAEKVGDKYWRTFGLPGTNFYNTIKQQYEKPLTIRPESVRKPLGSHSS